MWKAIKPRCMRLESTQAGRALVHTILLYTDCIGGLQANSAAEWSVRHLARPPPRHPPPRPEVTIYTCHIDYKIVSHCDHNNIILRRTCTFMYTVHIAMFRCLCIDRTLEITSDSRTNARKNVKWNVACVRSKETH